VWQVPHRPCRRRFPGAQLVGGGLLGSSLPNTSARCRRETQLLWNSAIRSTWLMRLRGFKPFLAAITCRAVEICSGLLELGEILDVLSARWEPNSRWTCTPRSGGVTMRWRIPADGRRAARCVALLVWPFEWQSSRPRRGSASPIGGPRSHCIAAAGTASPKDASLRSASEGECR